MKRGEEIHSGERAKRPLTIGMFTDTYIPETNGVVTSVVSTAAALRRRGHRVIIVAPAHVEGDVEDPDVFSLRSASFPFYPEFRMAFPLPAKILAALPQLPFDIVHVQSFFFIGCLGAYLARLRKVPLFFTYHTRLTEYAHYAPAPHRVTKAQVVWISREFSNRCDQVIAPSAGTVELLRSYGVDKPIHVIPSGVNVQGFAKNGPTPRAILAARPAPVLLYVGRLAKEKNLDLLLDALALLLERRPDAQLVVVGDGPHRAEMEQRISSAPLREHVRFVGEVAQRDLGPYYRDADVFVFASTSETQGLVLLEAMAHGLPVVAVDCPVTREVVGTKAGILTAEEPAALASAVERFIGESLDRRAERSAAAIEAAAPASVDNLTRELERMYVRAAGNLAVAQ